MAYSQAGLFRGICNVKTSVVYSQETRSLSGMSLLPKAVLRYNRIMSKEPDTGEKVALRITARGRVQGVFYRATVQEWARKLGVTGWVMNLPDGGVLAHVEHSSRETLDELAGRMRIGPAGANVESLSIETAQPEAFRSFSIKY